MTAINVYEACPVYETETFLLRLVKREDAAELLSCYSDKGAVEKCNADCCTNDFYCTMLEQMEECIDIWLKSYEGKAYVRFAVIPKTLGKPRGTVEVLAAASEFYGSTWPLPMTRPAMWKNYWGWRSGA